MVIAWAPRRAKKKEITAAKVLGCVFFFPPKYALNRDPKNRKTIQCKYIYTPQKKGPPLGEKKPKVSFVFSKKKNFFCFFSQVVILLRRRFFIKPLGVLRAVARQLFSFAAVRGLAGVKPKYHKKDKRKIFSSKFSHTFFFSFFIYLKFGKKKIIGI